MHLESSGSITSTSGSASSSRAALTLALFGILVGACSLDTRTNIEDPVEYQVFGLFDAKARVVVTIKPAGDTTATPVSDSLRGQLTIFKIHSAPKGNFSISKCGESCYGLFHAASSIENAGSRNGDSVEVLMFFDGDTRMTLTAHDYGDSLVGFMSTSRQSGATPNTGSELYLGHFVARR